MCANYSISLTYKLLECYCEDGQKYKNKWRAGMAHSQGVETYPDEQVRHDGQWIDDEPICLN